MKKIKEIIGFEYMYEYEDSVVIRNEKSLQQINENLDLVSLVEGNVFVVKVLGGELFYQLNDECNIHNCA